MNRVILAILFWGVWTTNSQPNPGTPTPPSSGSTILVPPRPVADPALLASQAYVPAPATPNWVNCNQKLMESYGLDGQGFSVSDPNLLCQGISDNCCPYPTQLQLYKKYITNREGQKVKAFYESFYTLFDKLFVNFQRTEMVAEQIRPHTSDYRDSNCLKIIEAIDSVKISRRKDDILPHLRRAIDFYVKSHAGFYCSLCDANAHPDFLTNQRRIRTDKDFCARMVQDTLNWTLFRYTFFPKIARLYSTLMTSCNAKAIFNVRASTPHRTRLFRKPSIEGPAAKCAKGFDKQFALSNCQDYCGKFSPLKFSSQLMGDYDRLRALNEYMERTIRRFYRKAPMATEGIVITGKASNAGRVLTEADHADHGDDESSSSEEFVPEHQNEDLSPVSDFNRKFETSIILPVRYRFREDTTIKSSVDYRATLFEPGMVRIYDVSGYRALFDRPAIDFYQYGLANQIDYAGAAKIFGRIYPDKDIAELLNL